MKLIARGAPLLLAAIVVISIAARQQAAPRIGFVNIEAVMQQTPGFAEARDTFATVVEGFTTELARMGDSITARIQEYNQQSVLLSPSNKAQREQEIQTMQEQYVQRQEEFQRRSGEQERQLLGPLEQRVQAVIDGIRAERNLAVIFDIGPGSQANPILAIDQALDLTARVIQRLQTPQ